MICPHCKYERRTVRGAWNSKDAMRVVEEIGNENFFYLPIKMERHVPWETPDQKDVIGCPKCGVLFMSRGTG